MEKKIVWAAVFLLFGVSAGIAQDPLPLDMAPNSVDDMYAGCKDKMEERVRKEVLPNELNQDENFKQVWNVAEEYYNKLKPPSKTLNKEQIMAIHAYTLAKPQIYYDFNKAVREQGSEYKKTFKYHTMHFFLTTALQTLNSLKPEKESCITTYRRVNRYFNVDALNKEIRFGSFTSSSILKNLIQYGNKSCFVINTCFGADIAPYSESKDSEAEVLIPPYETFKVTNIKKESELGGHPCEIVFELKSTKKTLSNLNCGLFPK